MCKKKLFGAELKSKVLRREPLEFIGDWAYEFYWEFMEEIDLDFRELLLTLETLELGPEFAMSYEELDQIADDLIAGRDIKKYL